MKSFKITLLTIVAALLAWPAAASNYRETTLDYEVDTSSPPELNALRTISRWESDTRAEMNQYEAADQRWVYDLDDINGHNIDAGAVETACGPTGTASCTVTLVASRGNGMFIDSQEFDADVNESSAGVLTVTIASADQALADAFVKGNMVISPLPSTARILEQEVFLEGVEKINDALSARAEVEYQWDSEFVRGDQVYIAKQFD